jgi:hypothetical protein
VTAPVIHLAAARARRAAPAPRPAAHLRAAPDRVILELADGTGFDLSPTQARRWAERLAAMAEAAEALAKGGDHAL